MTATDPLALGGTRGAAADRGHPGRPRAHRSSCSRRSPATSATRSPASSSPAASSTPSCASRSPTSPAPPASRSSPSRPRSCGWGPTTARYVVSTYDQLLRDEHFARAVVPDLVLRFGEMPTASRCAPGWRRAGPTRSSSTRRAAGTSRPGGRRRSSAPIRPSWRRAGRRGWRARSAGAARALAGGRGGGTGGARRRARRRRRGRRSPSRPSTALSARAHADGDLVYTASSMPIRDQETFLDAGDADVAFLCNRGANGIDGLISSGIGAAHAIRPADDDRHRRPRPPPRPRRLAALRGVETPVRILVIDNDGGGIFHFLPQEEALAGRSSRRCSAPPAASTSPSARRPLRPPPHPPRVPDDLPAALGRRHRPDRGQDRPRHQRRRPPAPQPAAVAAPWPPSPD